MIAPARSIAFEILLYVTDTDTNAHSDELLRDPQVNALSAQDRALATTLVMGTLRWQLQLDAHIRPLLARPDTKLSPAAETALRLGAFQLLHLDRIPPHAAIGESVELTRRAGEHFATGLVNAVLRKLAKAPKPTAVPSSLAGEFAHPAWLAERWARNYGEPAARAICAFDQQPAPVTIRLAHPEAEASLAAAGIELAPGDFLSAARRVLSGDVARTKAFRDGWIRIQDEGSQLVAELAGQGSRILDACAAPGGKTAILVERNPEAHLTAADINRRRLDSMRRNLSACGDRVRFAVQDAAAMTLEPEYDLILCDVPCSGTGTIARNPEIRFRLAAGDLARHSQRQRRILAAALTGLAPGGRLVYSTCSLEPEENEQVVDAVLAAHPSYERIPISAELAALAVSGRIHAEGAAALAAHALRDGCLRTIPGILNCDGFFAAILTRS
ncbi:transcription antitermination factor NusB [Silvibacterium dinghuense]|uniref:Methyltransferase domain-containing protein n=1 Tax=Silvibacterium dinghuense TaxID=1560006 RepID=A0A4Q1SH48_9BACT|nr:transcription antitermination factor NusB [Silvibacterium dinghuense]RXS96677.1 methyltransferase domain-containing protein [Silvibacterium dinghuense]GGG92767.1 ribosomal RNA small subunit methyltransferase B [Silvibacterium dinghuense]